jgi:DNA-binding NarL/FixJ family response regulator
LTPREEQVLRLLGEGLTNKEIAARLFVEASTVKNHVHSVLHKLSIHKRSEIATAGSGGPGARLVQIRSPARRRGEDI